MFHSILHFPIDRNQPYIETPILEEVVVVLKEWAEIIRGLYAVSGMLVRLEMLM